MVLYVDEDTDISIKQTLHFPPGENTILGKTMLKGHFAPVADKLKGINTTRITVIFKH